MRKIFIALAASLLISVGSTAQMNQVPVRSLAQAMKENKARAETIQTVLPKRAQQHEDDEEEGDEGHENEDGEEWWGENQDIDFDEQDNDFEFDEHKNAQGILGAIETAVNVGDEVAKTINPAIPTVNLSNKGNTVTLKVAGKLAQTQNRILSQTESQGIINAIEKAVSTADVNLAVSDKAGQPPTVKGSVSFKLAEAQSEGILGDIETAVNVGDEVAKFIDPAFPTVNLSNKGNTLTLNIDGEKISETQSKGIRGAIETADNVRDEVAKTIKRSK